MELTRIFALSVMILIASYANTYLGKSAEKQFPCESAEQAPQISPDKRSEEIGLIYSSRSLAS